MEQVLEGMHSRIYCHVPQRRRAYADPRQQDPLWHEGGLPHNQDNEAYLVLLCGAS